MSFKTTEEWTPTKLDEVLTDASPRLVKKDKKPQENQVNEVEKKNRDFMMTLKAMAEEKARRNPPRNGGGQWRNQ